MKRYGWPFGVIFIDIDNFKAVNDEYGHSIGDKVLRMVARTLSSSLRSFDVLGRYGGEEFIAIITNVDAEQLYSFANRLRILVEQSTLNTESGAVRVTVSIGATLAQPDDSVETIVKRADHLMYHSKTAGRNLVSMKLVVGQSDGDRLRAAWSAKRQGCDDLVAGGMGEQTMEEIKPACLLACRKR